MRTHSLIIDLRQQLPWHRRYISTTTTAVLWGCWFLLWRPMVVLFNFVVDSKPYEFHKLMNAFWTGLQVDMTLLLLCAGILWLWCRLVPSHTVKEVQQKKTSDYARHFLLNETEIVSGRQSKISTVYHNEQGQIVRIH